MESGPDNVEAAKIFDDAIINLFIIAFGHEAAEHLVPDDEHPRIVGIKILRVGRMVDPVVRRRVHHPFEPARHPLDRFGVDPKLVDEVQAADKDHHLDRKADKE